MDLAVGFEQGWKAAWTRIDGWVSGFFMLLPNLIVGAVVLALFVAVAVMVRSRIGSLFRRVGRQDLGDMLASLALWLVVLVGVLLSLTIVLPSLSPGDLVASFGIGSVAIGFAFKDILQNYLAGLLILLRQPFRRGDQIQVKDIEGTVHVINQRATLIRTFDNRIVVVPNADIYTSSVTVHTAYPTRRISLDVTVGYDNDVERVRDLILKTLSRLDEVRVTPPPQVVCWELGATSLALKVRFWIESRRSSEITARGRAVQAIKEAFQAKGIDPTDPQIVFNHIDRRRHAEADQGPPHTAASAAGDAPPVRPSRISVAANDPEAEEAKETSRGTSIEEATAETPG